MRFRIIKDKMKFYYFISNRLRTIKKILNWLNWAWVDTHAHKHLMFPLEHLLKFALMGLYTLVPLIFVVVMFASMFTTPWLTALLVVVGLISLPFLANFLEMPLKDESD